MRMLKIDMSSWSGKPVDFRIMKEQYHIDAVNLRLGAGLAKDVNFDYYFDLSGMLGLYRFCYWYFKPAYGWQNQALKFREALGIRKLEGIHFCDLEETGGILPVSYVLSYAHEWLKSTDGVVGKTGGIYTSPGFWKSIGGQNASWVMTENRHLWEAQWPWDNLGKEYVDAHINTIKTDMTIMPTEVPPWNRAIWWQFTAKATVGGLPEKDCDLSVSVGHGWEIIDLYDLPIDELVEPKTFDELVDRFMSLEQWAKYQGY